MNTDVTVDMLVNAGFDEVILATGIVPRTPQIPGIDHPKVLSYVEVLKEIKPVGQTVAIIGAGGIGFDIGEFLLEEQHDHPETIDAYIERWGIDSSLKVRGGLIDKKLKSPLKEITLMQRKKTKIGATLGKTTGWVHRANLKDGGVKMLSGVQYERIDDTGLHIKINGKSQLIPCDTIVICAGQSSNKTLYKPLQDKGITTHLVGGASVASELDATRAIREATELSLTI